MGRLIDIDSLKGCAIIRPISNEDIEHIKACEERISHNDIPTAYDVDKVVAMMDEAFMEFDDGTNCRECVFKEVCDDGHEGCVDTMIDVCKGIVRKGGVNE